MRNFSKMQNFFMNGRKIVHRKRRPVVRYDPDDSCTYENFRTNVACDIPYNITDSKRPANTVNFFRNADHRKLRNRYNTCLRLILHFLFLIWRWTITLLLHSPFSSVFNFLLELLNQHKSFFTYTAVYHCKREKPLLLKVLQVKLV